MSTPDRRQDNGGGGQWSPVSSMGQGDIRTNEPREASSAPHTRVVCEPLASCALPWAFVPVCFCQREKVDDV